jgi:hypothetical protein
MPPGTGGLLPEEGGLAGPLGPSQPWEPSLPEPIPRVAPSQGAASGSGTIEEPSFWDSLVGNGPLMANIESGAGAIAGMIPGVSNVVSAGNALYHGGSAIYDGMTGDRDGAIAHGAQALVNGVGVFLPDAVGQADAALTGNMMAVRQAAEYFGADPTQIPASFSDMASFAAVAGTNAIFGPDDSNWIAPGDAPTGTRGGEIAAGAHGLSYGIAGMLDQFGIASAIHEDGIGGVTEEINSFVAPAVLDIAQLFGADLAGPTSGVRKDGQGNYAQRLGDELHKDIYGPGPFGPPIEVPVGPDTLPVLPDELRY